MICHNCGSKVSIQEDRCNHCGEDLTVLQKAYRLSNSYYNIGLSKAKVGDLTGAIIILKKSLEINKRNTNARNLLGLIYFEIGETVTALSQWVISKHLDSESNDADYYMKAIQSNPTKLEAINQTIKRYNGALASAKQGDDDLAIIQLKKVINLNPNFVKALQLLGLLYIKNKEYDKALKYLRRARRIDVSNTITLRYLKEIEAVASDILSDKRKAKKDKKTVAPSSPQYISTPYKEEKPNIWIFVSLVAGIIIGVVASVILIIPTVRSESVNEYRKLEVKYNEEITKRDQEIASVEKEKEEILDQMKKLESEVEDLANIDYSSYDKLYQGVNLYLKGVIENDLDQVELAKVISQVDESKLERPGAVTIYNTIKDEVYLKAAEDLYQEGHKLYSARNYEEALPILLQAYEYNKTDINAIYFIGRTYQNLENDEKAIEFYTILTEDYPATKRANEAKRQLRGLQ